MTEEALVLDCKGSPLLAILHSPEEAADTGVLMVVGGGPQYRAGGHRQLTLWARRLASQGYAVMRFDYRGMGDSGGLFSGFFNIDDDLECAIEAFFREHSSLKKIVLWGECDASSAILMYAWRDSRVVAISLQNPWVRSEVGQAKTYIKHYYLKRLTDPAFWRKIFSFQFNPIKSISSLTSMVITIGRREKSASVDFDSELTDESASFHAMMLKGLSRFRGKILLYMSGRDLIAREFDELIASDSDWKQAFANAQVQRINVESGDHTFSSRALRDQVIVEAESWLETLD